MNKIFAFLPCFNEEGNIRALAEAWQAETSAFEAKGLSLQIFAIDDKSTDKTLQIIRELESQYVNFTVIAHVQNKGLGGALNTALSFFLSHAEAGDFMAFMDGDNTHKPYFVHSMLEQLRIKDGCVIASRYQKGSEVFGVPRLRLFLSASARFYYMFVLHVPNVRDYTCGFRIYKYECLEKAYKKYGDNLITKRSFSCMMELLYKLYRADCKFVESPFSLYYGNKQGESKMKIFSTIVDSLFFSLELRIDKQ